MNRNNLLLLKFLLHFNTNVMDNIAHFYKLYFIDIIIQTYKRDGMDRDENIDFFTYAKFLCPPTQD